MENERIAKLETKMDSISEAVMRLEEKLDEVMAKIEQRYLPRSEHDESIRRLEQRMDSQEHEIAAIRAAVGKVPAWAAALLTILTTIVGALIANFVHIQH